MVKKRSVYFRFMEKIIIDGPLGCWKWSGSIHPQGYGRFRVDGETLKAHRWSYEYFIGIIPNDKEIDHLCRNRSCVNPQHLEPVPHKENCRRGEGGRKASERQRSKTHCPQGHPYDEINTYWYGGRRGCKTCRANGGKGRYVDSKGGQ